MCAAQYAPRGSFHVLERGDSLAEIAKRGAGVPVMSVSGRGTRVDVINLADSLIGAKLFAEARSLARSNIPLARRKLGGQHDLTLALQTNYACAIYYDTNSSQADVHEGVAILEDVVRTARRVFGLQHPFFVGYREDLERARMRLAGDESREARG